MSLRKRCNRDRILPDGSPNPLYCPTSPRCEHVWHYDFRVNRARYRASTETADKHQARDIEAKERTRVLDGRHGIRRQPDTMFSAFAAEYLKTHAVPNKKPSTVKRDREMLARVLLPTFGGQLLQDITAFGIEQLKAKRLAAGCRPGTVNRELMLLKGLLTKAVEWKYLVASPAAGVRPIKGAGQRTRILTPDEQLALLAAYDKGRRRHVRPLIELLLITGARLGEVLALRWEDTTGGYLRFVDTKNGKPRRLPITPPMAAVLASVPHRDETYVFVSGRTGAPYTRILTGFKAAVKDAGINPADLVIHTLRHTALSRMMDAGLDVRTIMEISGHSSLAMLERYTHPTEQRKAEALNTYAMVTNRAQPSGVPAETPRKTGRISSKVPHHGSLTSSSREFLQAIRPNVAVFSVGRSNHFGHPAPDVLQRYRDIGAEIFRTDQDGAVMLDTDGTSIDLRTFTGRRLALSATAAYHEGTKDTKNTKQ